MAKFRRPPPTFGELWRASKREVEAEFTNDLATPAGGLPTFGDFARDYAGAVSETYAERADRRLRNKEFQEWLSSQSRGAREDFIPSPDRSSRFLAASAPRRSPYDPRAAAHLVEGSLNEPATAQRGRNRPGPVEPRLNTVARNLQVAAKASAADGRYWHPAGEVAQTIYGTSFEPRFHNRLVSVSYLRSRKRREVLFARRFVGRKGRSVR